MTVKQARYYVNGPICRYDRGVQEITTRFKATRYQVLFYRSLFYLVSCDNQTDTDTILSSGNRAAMMDLYFEKLGRKQSA